MENPSPTNLDIQDLLKKAELFSALLEDDLAYLSTRIGIKSYGPGKTVFLSGSDADRFYIVRSGEVSVVRGDRDGRMDEMARFLPGEVVGDFDFAMRAKRDASAIAVCASELLVFPMEGLTLEDLSREKPDTVARLLLRSLVMVSSRLRSTHKLISENAPWIRELKRQIYTDPTTGLLSKAFLDEEVAKLASPPCAVIMMKPDRFKELNDAHGHKAGDEAMAMISDILIAQTSAMGRGWAIRLKSNETALVIPACGEREAQAALAEIARSLSRLEMSRIYRGCLFRFTGSFSLGLWPNDEEDFKRLLEKASALLWRAWREGGDRAYRVPPRKEKPAETANAPARAAGKQASAAAGSRA